MKIFRHWHAISLVAVCGAGLLSACSKSSEQNETASLIQEIQKKGELTLCVASSRLHAQPDTKTGEWRGLGVEPMRFAASILNVKLVTVATTFGDMIPALQAKKCDLGTGLNMTPQRNIRVDYAGNYWIDLGAFSYNKEKTGDVDAKNWREKIDRDGVTIAVTGGGAAEQTIQRVIKVAKIHALPDNNVRDLELISGRAQFVFSDLDDLRYFPRQNAWAGVVVPEPPVLRQYVGYAIRKGYPYGDIQFFQTLLDNLKGTNQIDIWAEEFSK